MKIKRKGNLFICEDIGFTIRIDHEGPPLEVSLFRIVDRLHSDDDDEVSFLVYEYADSTEANVVTAKIENAEVFCEVFVGENGELEICDPPNTFSDRIALSNWGSVLARVFSIAIEVIDGVEYYIDGEYRESAPGVEYQIAEDGSHVALGYTRCSTAYLREDGSIS